MPSKFFIKLIFFISIFLYWESIVRSDFSRMYVKQINPLIVARYEDDQILAHYNNQESPDKIPIHIPISVLPFDLAKDALDYHFCFDDVQHTEIHKPSPDLINRKNVAITPGKAGGSEAILLVMNDDKEVDKLTKGECLEIPNSILNAQEPSIDLHYFPLDVLTKNFYESLPWVPITNQNNMISFAALDEKLYLSVRPKNAAFLRIIFLLTLTASCFALCIELIRTFKAKS